MPIRRACQGDTITFEKNKHFFIKPVTSTEQKEIITLT